MKSFEIASFVLVAGGLLAATGCNSSTTSPSPAVQAHRVKYVLGSAPGEPIPVVHAREDAAVKPIEVVLAGVIDAGEHEPWDEGRAAFIIKDVVPHDHEHEHASDGDHAHDDGDAHGATVEHSHEAGDEHAHAEGEELAHDEHAHGDHGHAHAAHDHADHDHENCPFCDRAHSDLERMAIVQFLGDDGKVIETDARELFGLKKNQKVVVRGKAEVDDLLGTLVVSATGIYVEE